MAACSKLVPGRSSPSREDQWAPREVNRRVDPTRLYGIPGRPVTSDFAIASEFFWQAAVHGDGSTGQ